MTTPRPGDVLDLLRTHDHANAVLSLDERVSEDDLVCDEDDERPLAAVAVLVKDNIDREGMVTTAGSLALRHNHADRDADVVASLRAAGAVVVGKSNLSEWANFRSPSSTSGWSAVGGLTTNPHDPSRSACGSSSGSAAAVAAGLVRVAIGTETDGSIVCPAAMCGVVGLKPTTGVLSNAGIVPISSRQDTAGPIAADVRLTAAALRAMAGHDVVDPDRLDVSALDGACLGVMRFHCGGYGDDVTAAFDRACAQLVAAGAEPVELVDEPPMARIRELEWTLLTREFRDDVDSYLGSRPAVVPVRSLADVVAFNRSEAEREMAHFGQEHLEEALATDGRSTAGYDAMVAEVTRLAGPEGLDRMLASAGCDALLAPTTGRAFRIRLDGGDEFAGACSTLPAVAGNPHLTVPMGRAAGLPVGLSLIGPRDSDARLLDLGHSFEHHRAVSPAPPPPIGPRDAVR